jgi:hypothetical protein
MIGDCYECWPRRPAQEVAVVAGRPYFACSEHAAMLDDLCGDCGTRHVDMTTGTEWCDCGRITRPEHAVVA